MAAFTSSSRARWQVKKLETEIGALAPRGGSSICSTSIGLIIFGGANREQVAFDDLALCPKVSVPGEPVEPVGDTEDKTDTDKEDKPSSVPRVGAKLTWKKVQTSGDIPQPRSGHATCSYNNFLFLFGGIDFAEESVYNDLYVLNLNTFTWKYVGETGAEIAARNSHSLGILCAPSNGISTITTAATAAATVASTATSSSGGKSSSGASSSGKGGSSSSSKRRGKANNISNTTANSNSTTDVTINNNTQYLVVFGGASVEQGPLGDTYYAALPSVLSEIEKEDFHVHWTELKMPVLEGSTSSASTSTSPSQHMSVFLPPTQTTPAQSELLATSAIIDITSQLPSASIEATSASANQWLELQPEAREMHSTSFSIGGGAHGSMQGNTSMFIAGGRGLDGIKVLNDVWELRALCVKVDEIVEAQAEAETSVQPATTTTTTTIVDKATATTAVFQWRKRDDLALATPRCAHIGAIVDCGSSSSSSSNSSGLHERASMFTTVGGFTGESISTDLCSININLPVGTEEEDEAVEEGKVKKSEGAAAMFTENWSTTRCGAAIGARFGASVCTVPKWLLDAKFPENCNTTLNVNDAGLLMYGGVNGEQDFGDLLLLLPPTRNQF